jgi:hypothetical protein
MVLFLREAMRAIASLGCEGVMRAIASSISKHVSSAGPHTDFQCRNRRRRMHCQRPQLVKGKSPQGSRVTVQIDQYLLCSAAPLTSCSSPALTASRLTSSMLPHVSLGASQLLKPASTTPRSYGRRHRSWHAHFKNAATRQPRRKPTVETCVDNTAKLRPQASVLAPRPCTCNAQRAAPRAMACTPRSSTCVAPRASAWAPRPSTWDAQRVPPRETAWAQRSPHL